MPRRNINAGLRACDLVGSTPACGRSADRLAAIDRVLGLFEPSTTVSGAPTNLQVAALGGTPARTTAAPENANDLAWPGEVALNDHPISSPEGSRLAAHRNH